jgi:hypothetical protein
VTPPGFEPRSSEPESDILSFELWGLFSLVCIYYFSKITNGARQRYYNSIVLAITLGSFCPTKIIKNI